MKRKHAIAAPLIVLLASTAQGDSLFTQVAQKGGTLISEEVARFDVGDIITVLIREKITANTLANTNTKKESNVEAEAAAAQNPFLVGEEPNGNNILKPGELPNWQINSKNESRIIGLTKRSSTLETTITCLVTEILENGNLKIAGDKVVSINREDSTLSVSGVIRPRDVAPDNSISSTKVANAQVLLRGKGPLWNNQRRGLVTRFLDWFSPF